MTEHRIPMPPGVDADMMQSCILILDAVEVTADDPDWLTVIASSEAEAAAVAADAAGWIRHALAAC